MGDRGNIVLEFQTRKNTGKRGLVTEDPVKSRIFLYTHWGGSELPTIVRSALQRGRPRWGDDSYLARIIFNEVTKGQEMSETGFGLSPYITDNEHDLLIVNLPDQEIYTATEASPEKVKRVASFNEFVTQPLTLEV